MDNSYSEFIKDKTIVCSKFSDEYIYLWFSNGEVMEINLSPGYTIVCGRP